MIIKPLSPGNGFRRDLPDPFYSDLLKPKFIPLQPYFKIRDDQSDNK